MDSSYHAMNDPDVEMIKDNPTLLYHIIHDRERMHREEIEHRCAVLSEHIYPKIIEYILHTPRHLYTDFDVCLRIPMRIYVCFRDHTQNTRALDETFTLLAKHTNQRLSPHQIYMNKVYHLIDPICDEACISCFFCGIPVCIQYIQKKLDLSCSMYFRVSIKTIVAPNDP